MRTGFRIGGFAGVLTALVLLAASVGAGGAPAGSAAQQASNQNPDFVNVNFVINRFVRQGRTIVAKGEVIARYDSEVRAPAVVRKAFTARLGRRPAFASAARICNVLELTIQQLHLELLGLIVHLDRVHLTIRADSNGGVLGALFCSIAGTQTATAARLNRTAAKMTRAGRANGLNQGIAGFRAQVAPGFTQTGTICPILDLILGPLDLNLLGLLVHLNRVHLTITAERGGGVLGDLFCSLAGGPAPPPPPPPAPLPLTALATR